MVPGDTQVQTLEIGSGRRDPVMYDGITDVEPFRSTDKYLSNGLEIK